MNLGQGYFLLLGAQEGGVSYPVYVVYTIYDSTHVSEVFWTQAAVPIGGGLS